MTFDPAVALGLSAAAALALGGPVVLGAWLWRRLGANPVAWAIGAATFFVSQVVLRLPWQIALGLWLSKHHPEPAVQWAWLVVSAFSAGLFEETGRYVAYRFAWKDRTATGALMLGAGHGGIESMLLVGLNLAVSAVMYVGLTHGYTLGLGPEKLEPVRQQFAQLTPVLALAGGVERVSSMAVHCGLSVLVLQCFTRGSRWWLLAAIGFHGLSNLVGVAAAKALGVWPGEGVIACFGLLALAWTVRIVSRDRRAREALTVFPVASSLHDDPKPP
ncbi:MAG: YhfC family intramembrane metalloprotease [Myxococcaceae bacterium]|nr:YhfC family intramembrane metalloprotease [Myxococcaceae bacterium]